MLGRLHIKFEEIPSEIQLGKKNVFLSIHILKKFCNFANSYSDLAGV